MYLLDRDIADCRALLVDGNPTSRSILVAQMREFGVVHIVQCSRIAEARKRLELETYDLVLCEQHFHGDGYSGQDLLDDLRRAQMLPYATVFLMITGEASYASVAEAAESALDGYLLKPYTAQALAERVKQARARKRALNDVFAAIEADRPAEAARLALQRFRQRAPFWLYAARIGAELLLRLGQGAGASQVYEAVLAHKPLAWARLGVARAQADAGQAIAALRSLDALVADEPQYADALDLRARLQLEQGQLDAALASCRDACALTPGSIERVQRQGLLAFYRGQVDEATKTLERAVAQGIGSKMFDPLALLLLGALRFRARERKGLLRCLDNLEHLARGDDTPRLPRFVRVLRTLDLMLQRQVGAVAQAVDELAAERLEPGFDLEAACNLLTLLALLSDTEIRLEQVPAWTEQLALRFCTTKGATELLCGAAIGQPHTAEAVQRAHARVLALAEQAMALKMDGDPRGAVRALIAHGAQTHNVKLLEMAAMTLQRYRAQIADADALATTVDALRERHPAAALPRLGQAVGRQAGGLRLRTVSTATPAAMPATAAA